MKHLFGIASHLTFNVARKIILADNIQPDDCYFLLLRNYEIPPEYNDIYHNRLATSYNTDIKHGRIFAGLNIFKTAKNMREFDALIDGFIGEGMFMWYTSVCYNDICSMMVTNDKCAGYYVMEDGLVSYERSNPQAFVGWRYVIYKFLLVLLYPRIFTLKNNFITTCHPKFKGCIATSQLCFPLHQQYLKVIGSPFEPQEYAIYPDAVISVDPLFNSRVDNERVAQIFKSLAEFMAEKQYKLIAFKLHPRFNSINNKVYKEYYCRLLKELFPNIHELPQDLVLENLLAWCKADFYSCDSSVALYVSQEGVRCYSMMPLLKGTPAYHPTDIMTNISEQISL